MNTSEAIRMIEENNELVFSYEDGGITYRLEHKKGLSAGFVQVEAINKLGEISELSSIILTDKWKLVPQPVTWQKAFEAWARGRTIECEIDGTRYHFGTASNKHRFTKEMIEKGNWSTFGKGVD